MKKTTVWCILGIPTLAALLALLLSACSSDTTFLVTYDLGDGRVKTEIVEKDGLITPPKPVRPGYTFDCWYVVDEVTDTSGETDTPDWVPPDDFDPTLDLALGEECDIWQVGTDRVTDDVILRAHWFPKSDVIYFDANGGTCDTESMTVWYGYPFDLPEPTRKGHHFAGWYGEFSHVDAGRMIWKGVQSSRETMTYIAKWTNFTPTDLHVYFGNYEQNDDPSDGAEPIEWVVLEERGGYYLLFSRFILDAQPLHGAGPYAVPWADCTLRTWLNDTFLKTAFTPSEQDAIWEKNLSDTGTRDKVFLLNEEEVRGYLLPWDIGIVEGTFFAEARGLEVIEDVLMNHAYWWIRSPRSVAKSSEGSGSFGGSTSGLSLYGVRPALWVEVGATRPCQN